MEKKVTIYDIAAQLGISAATVSRALNGNPKISDQVRKQVQETAARLGYEQNKVALALKSGRTQSVGVIVPRIDRAFFSTVIRGVEEELAPHGYHVIISQSYDTESRELENISTLLNARVDGILMSISNATKNVDAITNSVVRKGIPLIFFDRKKDVTGVSSVTINDFDGGYQATKHLIEQGCTRIAHLAGDCELEIYEARSQGYRQALQEHGIEFNDKYVIHSQSRVEDGQEAVKKLMKLRTPPDAIFSSSDYAALGAIQELKSRGVRIPEDFCVVGFANEPFTKFMELSISSVDQFPLEMGHIAAKVFLQQISEKGNTRFDQKVVLAPKLHIRKSSQRKA